MKATEEMLTSAASKQGAGQLFNLADYDLHKLDQILELRRVYAQTILRANSVCRCCFCAGLQMHACV